MSVATRQGTGRSPAWAEPLVRSPLGSVVLALSSLGYPLTQAVIARWGRRGAVLADGVAAGLLVRDAALAGSGAPARLQPAPRALLRLELAAAAAATLLGLAAIARPAQRPDSSPAGVLEGLRRLAVGVLFGLHSWRFWVYLSPGSGRLVAADGPAAGSVMAAAVRESAARPPLAAGERLRLDVGRQLDRRLTPLGAAVYRLTRGGITRLYHVDALLLTTRGRRSGRQRTVVLQFFRDGDGMLLAAANDGGSRHPGWYHNLTASPDAWVEVMGRSFPVRAEELPPAEAAEAWERIILPRAPSYEAYLRATTRVMPVVRLTPVGPRPV